MNVRVFVETWQQRFPRPDPHTNANNASMIRPFVEAFGDRELDAISKAEAYEWGVAHPGAIRYARTLYGDAINVGLVESSPFKGLRFPTGASIGRTYATLPTLAQVAQLEAAADPIIAGAITFAAYTGLRLGEQLGIRGADFDGDTIYVATQLDARGARKPLKGGTEPRRVFLCAEALQAVSGLLSASDDALLWPINRTVHYHAWNAARKSVGLAIPWHLLRHVALNRFVESGAQPRDVGYLAGHRDDTHVRRLYARHVDEDGAMDRLREVAHG